MQTVRYTNALSTFLFGYDVFAQHSKMCPFASTEDKMRAYAERFDWSGDNSAL